MKKSIMFFYVLFLISYSAFAQRGGFSSGYAYREQTLMQFPAATDLSNSKRIKGSRFYDPEYQKGELWTSNGLHFKDELEYKFDEVENSVQIKTEDGKELVVDANLVDSFRLYLNDRTIYYYKAHVPDGKKDEEKIFQVVHVGKQVLLFKIASKTIKHYNYQGAFGDGRTVGEYVSHHHYYIKVGNKPLTRIKLNKKDITKKITLNRAILLDQLEYIEPFEEITEKKFIDILRKVEKITVIQ